MLVGNGDTRSSCPGHTQFVPGTRVGDTGHESWGHTQNVCPGTASWGLRAGDTHLISIPDNEMCVSPDGPSAGASRRLKAKLNQLELCETSREVVDRTLAFIRESERNLKSLNQPNVRLPMSTEVLESVFGRYKQLEGQHSQGGFTSLLASFATLLKPITAEEVKESFASVSTKKMREWVHDQLGETLQSRKNQAYAEYQSALAAQP